MLVVVLTIIEFCMILDQCNVLVSQFIFMIGHNNCRGEGESVSGLIVIRFCIISFLVIGSKVVVEGYRDSRKL